MPITTLAPAIISFLLDSSPLPSGAFNVYDSSTFAASTCKPLAIEKPVGIFVSPTGKANAQGTEADPLDLATVFERYSTLVQPGDTLWLMEGTYKGNYTSFLNGTEDNPINVKPYPGKHVKIQSPILPLHEFGGGTLNVQGAWVNYYGLEVTSLSTDRLAELTGSSGYTVEEINGVDVPTNYIDVQGGLSIGTYYNSSHSNIINTIVHDTKGGLSSFSASTDAELYGNIIYNNGWTGQDRGHGHAMYTQNKGGYKKITNNIFFFGFGTGIHAYYTGSADNPENKLQNYDIEKNVWFLAGASDPSATQKKDNIIVGGVHKPVVNLLVKNNIGYSDNNRGLHFGYVDSVSGQTGLITDNYFSEGMFVRGTWNTLDVQNTEILRGFFDNWGPSSQAKLNELSGNNFQERPPTDETKIFVSANRYDPRRARVTIFNYPENDTVLVDVSNVLKQGEAYRIHSVYDLFGEPIIAGIYNGKDIAIPMGTIDLVQPMGLEGGVGEEDNPKKKFGVFIITHAGCL